MVDEADKIEAVLFDMDGLLLNTEDLYTVIGQRILDPFGLKFTWDVKSKMMGKRQVDAVEVFIHEYQLHGRLTVEQYIDRQKELEVELFPQARPLPGVMKLVKHLYNHGVPIAVATSSNTKSFELKTRDNHELFQHFSVIVRGDDVDVKRGKPHPDIFQVASKRLGQFAPDKVLVFEDALNGVVAAQSAGMKCVWVPDARFDQTLLAKPANLILNTLEHFKPEQFGLPPYQD
jgi:pseudouridine-5'-monophosphatase